MTKAERITKRLFMMCRDTFYDSGAAQIDFSKELDEQLLACGLRIDRNGYPARGNLAEAKSALKQITKMIEEELNAD